MFTVYTQYVFLSYSTLGQAWLYDLLGCGLEGENSVLVYTYIMRDGPCGANLTVIIGPKSLPTIGLAAKSPNIWLEYNS